MNDLHVAALIYRVEHGPGVSYLRARPLEHEEEGFRVRIEDRQARFELKDHCATADEARALVEPFIKAWELKAGLDLGPGAFQLVFDRADVVDRNPVTHGHTNGGVVEVHVTDELLLSGEDTVHTIDRGAYPWPHRAMTISPDVQSMYDRYRGHRDGREPLAGMAYFCLSVLESSTYRKSARRDAAAKRYRINKKVLDTLGTIVSEKGGPEARKRRSGAPSPDFTPAERQWIDQAVRFMIWRAAEAAHGPLDGHKIMTMADLPPL